MGNSLGEKAYLESKKNSLALAGKADNSQLADIANQLLALQTSGGVNIIAFDSLVTNETVTISPGEDITSPTITPSLVGGTYSGNQTITLSANETATIYYTIDGSTPTILSPVYSSPISITSSKTLKYFGKDAAGNMSTVQSQTYTINASNPELVVNGDFAQGSTGWTLTSGSWDFTGGIATLTPSATWQRAEQFIENISQNTNYTVNASITGGTATVIIYFYNGGSQISGNNYTTMPQTITTPPNTTRISVRIGNTTTTGVHTFDNVSLKLA